MLSAVLAQLFWIVVFGSITVVMMRRSSRRQDARDKSLADDMHRHQQHLESLAARPATDFHIAVEPLNVPSDTPAPVRERTLAELQRIVGNGGTDEEYSPPLAVVDLSELTEELPERLSEAGYAGGPLHLAAVECLGPTHVVLHLEARTP